MERFSFIKALNYKTQSSLVVNEFFIISTTSAAIIITALSISQQQRCSGIVLLNIALDGADAGIRIAV
jgi:hypothetical protein